MNSAVQGTAQADQLIRISQGLQQALTTVLAGRPAIVNTTVAVLLARGHLLIEDVPGVGKTTLARAIAKASGASIGRIQFTPDLLPSDITGVNIYQSHQAQFEFRPGPIFANIVIGDEINRASPKTQSALLESMQEGRVTIDGHTHQLPQPFLVVATQNPVEMAGTYPLPEAQRDRFMAQISIGYPDRATELQMLDIEDATASDPINQIQPITNTTELEWAIGQVGNIYTAPTIREYIIDLVARTRTTPDLTLGASPRAAIQLLRAARGYAITQEREYVIPEDIQQLAPYVLQHRLQLSAEGRLAGLSTQKIVEQLIATTAIPRTRRTVTGN